VEPKLQALLCKKSIENSKGLCSSLYSQAHVSLVLLVLFLPNASLRSNSATNCEELYAASRSAQLDVGYDGTSHALLAVTQGTMKTRGPTWRV
jgi:hypothetical protein